ncbi:MAG TPA: response regulator [Thermoplasmata archaeon]|nr:response regulator [Thermoplasmata archaeon]
MRALVVDDDKMFREELTQLLSDNGHRVTAATSVPKALEQLAQDEFDIVFTDLKMPRHSGLELLREARRRWPRTMVVMVTGFATVETAVEAMKVGAFDYVRKPFTPEELQATLQHAEEERRFRGPSDGAVDAALLAAQWTAEGFAVLRLTSGSAEAAPNVSVVPTNFDDPDRVRAALEEFLAGHSKAGAILEGADRLIDAQGRATAAAFLDQMHRRVEPHGPFAVTFDPDRVSQSDVLVVRAAVVAPSSSTTLEALVNPIRRAVLRRLAAGPCSFTEAMHAAELDDSAKFSFHVRKLVQDGLILHEGERYRLTERGHESVRLLQEVDGMAAPGVDRVGVFPERART